MASWGRVAAAVLRNFLRRPRALVGGVVGPRRAVLGGPGVVLGSLVGTGLAYCYHHQNANRTALPFTVHAAEEEEQKVSCR